MLKGKLKYIVLGLGVFVLALGIMRYTPLAFGNSNGMGNFQESRPFYGRFMDGPMGPRGHHRMMWDFESEEEWEEFRQEVEENWENYEEEGRNFRGPRGVRGCMGYFFNDNEVDEGINK